MPLLFALVVPVKTLHRAKSRLHGHHRGPLMRAFALDALQAAIACPVVGSVHVVTDDEDLAGAVTRLGCELLPDRGDGDLNAALATAVAGLDEGPVAAMLGDLPCLVPDDLATALAWIADGTDAPGGVVADADGTGSTLLAVRRRADFRPHFGPGSRAAHVAAGFAEVPHAAATLRRDVDTADDLALATRLGLGRHTRTQLDSSA